MSRINGLLHDVQPLESKIDQIVELLKTSKNTVVITGAGISTDSGIKDFRGPDGLYKEEYLGKPSEYWVSRDAFMSDTVNFYKFMNENLLGTSYKPNDSHYILKEMQDAGFVDYIVTQNIDNLHQDAGSDKVIDLHGNLKRFYCPLCKEEYSSEEATEMGSLPGCKVCGNKLRPDIVLYGENIPYDIKNEALNRCAEADVLIVIGSSLMVNTACDLLDMYLYGNSKLVIINKGETYFDNVSIVKIDENIGEVLGKIKSKL